MKINLDSMLIDLYLYLSLNLLYIDSVTISLLLPSISTLFSLSSKILVHSRYSARSSLRFFKCWSIVSWFDFSTFRLQSQKSMISFNTDLLNIHDSSRISTLIKNLHDSMKHCSRVCITRWNDDMIDYSASSTLSDIQHISEYLDSLSGSQLFFLFFFSSSCFVLYVKFSVSLNISQSTSEISFS